MSINSRDKGRRGEQELVRVLKEYGYNARRTAQVMGKTGQAADVEGLRGIHIECKRNERLNIMDAVDQAVRDEKHGRLPTVFHRKNNCPWLVTMRLDDWMQLYREWEAGKEVQDGKED